MEENAFEQNFSLVGFVQVAWLQCTAKCALFNFFCFT